MPAEGKTRRGVDLLAKVVENDTTLIQSYVVVDHLPVRLGDGGNSTGTQGRLEPLDAAPPRDAYAWLWPIQGLVTWDEAIFYSKPAARKRAHGRIGRAHIPRLVCRQGPPDFESGIAT